jgi:hypothetical protein
MKKFMNILEELTKKYNDIRIEYEKKLQLEEQKQARERKEQKEINKLKELKKKYPNE